jgi:hypothetical protein
LRYSLVTVIVLILVVVGSSCGTQCEEPSSTCEELSAIPEGIELRGLPSFSPDGVTMVYLAQEGLELELYDRCTAEARQFNFISPIYNPQISPGAESVFYTQLSESGYFSELWTLDLETGQKTKLTDEEYGDIYSYVISPDGSYLAFWAFHDNSNRQSLFLMRLTTPPDIHPVGGEMAALSIDDYIQPVFTTDGDRVLFAFKDTIYVINVSGHQLEKVVDVGKQVRQLSAASDYGVFVARQDSYYQVFSVNLRTGEIEKLTLDETNKLLPCLAEDGYLYYLDAGATLSPERLSYLVWLTSRNSTSVFKDYRNDWGRLAWDESYALEFLITAYQAFSDDYFREEFVNHAGPLLGNMDINLGIADYNGLSTYGWSATRYSIDKVSRKRDVVHDGMIGVPLAKYIMLTKDETHLDSELEQDLLDVLLNLVMLHDEEWVEHETDDLAITEEIEGYYIFPEGSPAEFDGVNLPFNQQNRFGTLLVQLYEISGEPRYLDMALKMGSVFQRHLIPSNGGYSWPYWWGKAATGWNEDDDVSANTPTYDGHQGLDNIDYATLELEFVTALAQYGVFDNEDMERFANTYLDPASDMAFRKSKVRALLSEYSERVTAEMGEIDIMGEPWPYIPYLGLMLEDGNDLSWELKRIDTGTTAEPETLFSGNNLVYFLKTGAGIAIVDKGQNQPYTIELLPE